MATFVLVHGTTAGGWVWKGLTPQLEAAGAAIPRTYIRFTKDKVPGQFWLDAFKEVWRRVQEGGWRVREVDTVHQIVPDPMPKLAVLLELFPD